jgi:hypothetical protein
LKYQRTPTAPPPSCGGATDKIHSINLSLNHSNEMLVLLKDHPEKISWRHLSINSAPVAVEILRNAQI